MPDAFILTLNGANLVIKIGTKTYTLTAPESVINFSGDPAAEQRARFYFKADFEDAVDFGTMDDLMNQVQSILVSAPLPAGAESLVARWTTVQTTLQNAPVLGSALATAGATNIRIVEIGFDVKKKTTYSGTNPVKSDFSGTMKLGVVFTPASNARPRFFNIEVVAFGATVTVGFSGSINDVAFPW